MFHGLQIHLKRSTVVKNKGFILYGSSHQVKELKFSDSEPNRNGAKYKKYVRKTIKNILFPLLQYLSPKRFYANDKIYTVSSFRN